MAILLLDAALQAGLAGVWVVQTTANQGIESVNHPSSRVRYQLDFLGVAGLEPNGRAARKIEPHAVGLHAIEDKRPVDLEEVVVGADLHWPVTCVVNADRHDGTTRIELDVGPVKEILARNHVQPPRNRGW